MKIQIKVIPNAKKHKIIKGVDCLRVYISEPAIEGKANKKVIEVLAEYFQAKKRCVKIIKGLKQRNKLVEIEGI